METLERKSLFAIRAEHYDLMMQIEDADGELTPELESSLQLTEHDFQEKAVSYAYVSKTFDNATEAIDKEIKRLQELKKKSITRSEMFKEHLEQAMNQFGIERIETPLITLSFRKSQAVEFTAEALVPKEYWDEKTTYTISKTRIKEAIKEGVAVDGAELVNRRSLQIK